MTDVYRAYTAQQKATDRSSNDISFAEQLDLEIAGDIAVSDGDGTSLRQKAALARVLRSRAFWLAFRNMVSRLTFGRFGN